MVRADIVTWAEGNWYPPSEGGRPIVFQDHQKRILRHVFTPDADGRLRYQIVLWSEPKKSGKTEIAALVSYWLAKTEAGFPEVYMLANDFEQSRARAFQAMSRAVRRFGAVKVLADRVLLPNGAILMALPCDYPGAAGANPTLSVWDELWAYTSESGRRLWEEMSPVPTRRNSLRFIVTYAGFADESALLEELYAAGLEGEPVPGLEDIDNGDGSPACRAVDGMFMFWSHKGRMPWQTSAYYASQKAAPGFRPNAYLRLHENRWVQAQSAFIDMAKWDRCVDPDHRRLMPSDEHPLFVGVDAATKRDSSAVVAVYYDRDDKKVKLAHHRIWTPQPGEPLELEATVEAELLEMRRSFRLRRVLYDPYQMARSADTLRRAGLPMEELPQTLTNLTPAGQTLFDLINGRNLVVYPGADDLREHIAAAVAVESPRGWRLAKEKASRKIDAAVALSFACLPAVLEGARAGLLDLLPESGSALSREEVEDLGLKEAGQPVIGGIMDRPF